MDHLFIAPTFMCAASIAASLDDPQYREGRKGLLLTNNAAMAEISDGLSALPGFSAITERFDAVATLNDIIAPYHPRTYSPPRERAEEVAHAVLERLGLGPEVSITAQSVHVEPTAMLMRGLPEAPVHAVSDGLMSYGPTRVSLTRGAYSRLQRLIYLDLVEDVDPLLLTEYGVPRSPLSPARFKRVVDDFATRAFEERPEDGLAELRPDAVILGQYLAQLRLLTLEQEQEHHVHMLEAAAKLGATSILFKPHPSTPHGPVAAMRRRGAELGVDLDIYDGPMPVEALLGQWKPKFVIGSFSTGMATARVLEGIETITVGCPEVAANLPRFQDSNRIPLLASYTMSRAAELDEDGTLSLVDPPGVSTREAIVRLASKMQPQKLTTIDYEGSEEEFLAKYPQLAPFFENKDGDLADEVPGALEEFIRYRPRLRKVVHVLALPRRAARRFNKRVLRPLWRALRHELPE